MTQQRVTRVVMETTQLDPVTGHEQPFQRTTFEQFYPEAHAEEQILTQQKIFPGIANLISERMVEAGSDYIERHK